MFSKVPVVVRKSRFKRKIIVTLYEIKNQMPQFSF